MSNEGKTDGRGYKQKNIGTHHEETARWRRQGRSRGCNVSCESRKSLFDGDLRRLSRGSETKERKSEIQTRFLKFPSANSREVEFRFTSQLPLSQDLRNVATSPPSLLTKHKPHTLQTIFPDKVLFDDSQTRTLRILFH